MAPMVLSQIEARRLADRCQTFGGGAMMAGMIYCWMWLRCADADLPGILYLSVADLRAVFPFPEDFMQGLLSQLAERVRLEVLPGILVLPEYLRAPQSQEQASLWAHHVWELEHGGRADLAAKLDEQLREHMTGARSLRRAYDQARNFNGRED